MKKTNPKVDAFLRNVQQWLAELTELRAIALDSELTEELKWGQPCYALQKKNVVLIHAFKEYCALLFFKGALLKDPQGLLVQQTENVQSARQIRFTSLKQIVKLKSALKAYIEQATEVERAGLKVEMKKTNDFPVAEEFQVKLDKSAPLKKAFEALTPGRQRAYLLYFSSAKQAKTREARVAKCIPKIRKGKGMDDE